MSTDNTHSNPEFMTQAELDALMVEFRAAHGAGGVDPDIDIEQITKGPRPKILKEAIQDPKVLARLMSGGVDGALEGMLEKDDDLVDVGKDFFNQDDIDALIAKQIEELKATEEVPLDLAYFEGERPPIEREEISDPEVLGKLLGETVANPGALSQDDIDELISAQKQASEAAQKQASEAAQNDTTESAPKAQSYSPAAPVSDKIDQFEKVEEDLGLLSQDDLDVLLSGGTSKQAAEEVTEFGMDQAAIDALIAGGSDDPEAASEPAGQDDIDAIIAAARSVGAGSGDDAVNQDDIDAIIAAARSDASEVEDGPVSQDDIDALIAGGAGDDAADSVEDDIDALLLGTPAAKAPVADDGPVSQDDIDALIAGASDEPATVDDGPVSQDDIDALLLGVANEAASVDSGPIGQDDIDALLLGMSSAEEPDASPETDHLESLIEAELKTLSSNDSESLLQAGDSHDVLNSIHMEDRLDGVDEDAFDGDFGAAADANMTVIESAPANAPRTVAPEEVSEETLQEVGGENIVAAADLDTPELSEDAALADDDVIGAAAPAAAMDDLLDEDEDYVRPTFKRRAWLDELAKVPPIVVQVIKEEPYRALAGIAAGLIAMITAFLLMSASEYRHVSEYAAIALDEGSHLRRAMTTAEILIEDHEYAEAAATLEKALMDANPRSPLYLDAEYIQLDAEVRMQGVTLSSNTANRLHGKIDRIVTEEPLHPRRPEALFWKAQLYEKEGNLQAARVEYRQILRNESQADNLHRVLLALGELELKTDRPVNAAEYLQELRRNYPGTPEAARGRLLLGDALVAAGDPEGARVTYINVAQNDPAGQLGAEAFSRLGELAFESGEYESAISELEGRLSRSSSVEGNAGVTLLLAKAYRAVGRHDDAKNLLQGLIDFFPESEVTPLARIQLSQVMNDMGLEREAVRYATQTTQIYPDNPEVLRNAGELLALHGDSLDAARAMLAAHSAGAGDPDLLLSAGRLFVKGGSKDRAERAFRQLSEDYARSRQGLLGHIELAKLLYEKGEVSEALERLEGLALTTNSSARKLPVLAALGELYNRMGLPAKVAEVYGEAASLSDEPDVVAESVVALIDSGSDDEALILAQNVNVQQLEDTLAYDYLNALGKATMLKDAREGLGYLEQAHASYPDARTSEGVQRLLEANLSLNRSARARAILAELENRISDRENAFEKPRLEQAAITYGNFLFDRGDFRAAADAYSLALNAQIVGDTDDVPDMALSERQLWSLFQLANAKFKLSEFGESIPLYERVAGSSSRWAVEASTKLESARLEQRLRGQSRSEARNAG